MAGAYCDTIDSTHTPIHANRLKARQLAHAGRFDSALLMLEVARDLANDPSHRCAIRDSLLLDIDTTEWYVNRLRRPSLLDAGGIVG